MAGSNSEEQLRLARAKAMRKAAQSDPTLGGLINIPSSSDVTKLPGAVLGDREAALKSDADFYTQGQVGDEKFSSKLGRYMDTAKAGLGKFGDVVSSGAGKLKDFAAENKGALGLGADVISAYGGYQAGKDASEQARKQFEDQKRMELQIGSELLGTQYDPERYSKLLGRQAEIQQGRGQSALTRQLRAESLQKGAAVGQSGIEKASEMEARKNKGVGSAGATIAANILAGQQGSNVTSAADREADIIQEARYDKSFETEADLRSKKTQEEADLAAKKALIEGSRAQLAGGTRKDLAGLDISRGQALQQLYGAGADIVKQGLSQAKTPEEAQYQARMKNAELAKVEKEAGISQQPSPEKIAAAKNLSARGTMQSSMQQPQAQQPQSSLDNMNQRYTPAKPQAPQQAGVQGILQGVQQKGQELFSKIPQAQQQQLKDMAGKQISQLTKKLPFKF